MGTWKVINRIAFALGIVFVVFSAVAAVVEYEIVTLTYPSAPVKYFDMNTLAAALPFITAAVVSFVVQILTASSANPETETEPDEEMTKQEKETQAQQEAEAQAEQEIDFEEKQ